MVSHNTAPPSPPRSLHDYRKHKEMPPTDRDRVHHDRMERLEQALGVLVERTTIAPTPNYLPKGGHQPQHDVLDQAAEAFKPARRLVGALKWTAGILVAIGAVFTALYDFKAGVATKTELTEHIEKEFIPVRDEVKTIRSGVDVLVTEKRRELEIARLRRALAKFDDKHRDELAGYHAARAAGKWSKKPTKSDGHLSLEVELETLLEQQMTMPVKYGG